MLFERFRNIIKLDNIKKIFLKFKRLPSDEFRIAYLREVVRFEDLSEQFPTSEFKSSDKSLSFKREGEISEIAGNIEEARNLYTKSVSYAPFPSAQGNYAVEDQTALAKASAHRAVVLYKLKKYALCLRDIAYAYENMHSGVPNHGLTSLETGGAKRFDMKATLISLLLEEGNMVKEKETVESEIEEIVSGLNSLPGVEINIMPPPPELSYGRNPAIPNCSAGVELKSAGHMGRGLFTTRDIEPGDVIIVEDPFSWKLDDVYIHSRCSHCMKHCFALIPCLHCSEAMFCSEECRKAAWDMYHDVDCQLLPLVSALNFQDDYIILRTVIIARNMFNSLTDFYKTVKGFDELQKDEKPSELSAEYNYYQLYKLIVAPINKFRGFNMLHMYHCLYVICFVHLLETKTNFFSISNTWANGGEVSTESIKNFVGLLLLKHIRNCVRRIVLPKGNDLQDLQIGQGIYSSSNLINHSCDPNVFGYTWPGKTLVVRAIKKLKSGEQVLLSYGPVYYNSSLKERKENIFHSFGFVCSCSACNGNFSAGDLPIICEKCGTVIVTNIYDYCSKTISCNICQSIVEINENFIDNLNQLLVEIYRMLGSHFSQADLSNIVKKLKITQSTFGRGCLVFPFQLALREYYIKETIGLDM